MKARINTPTRPWLELSGADGNAFWEYGGKFSNFSGGRLQAGFILGRAKAAAQGDGWASEDIEAVINEATSGDYDHLLTTITTYFEVS